MMHPITVQSTEHQIQMTAEGLLIPADWFQDMGPNVNVQKTGEVIIIETRQRQRARIRLQEMVRQLRQASHELEPISNDELTDIVNEVRTQRAGHY